MIIKCPKCGTESSMSLSQPIFEGPYRCWKCRDNFLIKLVNNKLKSIEPLSHEEFEQRQRRDALKKKMEKPPQD